MARQDYESWIPVEMGSSVITTVNETSAIERFGRPEPMASDTKQVPRIGDFTVAPVAKGGSYAETTTTDDYVELIARKVGGVKRIAEEDLTDTVTGERTIALEQDNAAKAMAVFFDNAGLGTTAAMNGTTVLYTSVYRAVRNNDSGAGYTADANYTAAPSSAFASNGSAYGLVSEWLGKYEESLYWNEGNTVVIAHPMFKRLLRNTRDANGRPYWTDPQNGGQGELFGTGQLVWSRGARTSPTNTQTPAGNPLLVIGNRDLLIKGMARLSPEIATPNPGFATQRARNGVGFLTDEALIKAAMRRGFVVGQPKGFSVMEYTG